MKNTLKNLLKIMSELDIKFNYDRLDVFISKEYNVPKNVQVIPVFHIKDSGDVFAVLVMNSTLCLKSLSVDFLKNKTLNSFISDSIRFNSYGTIYSNEDYILENSHVAYSTCRDVITDTIIINPRITPTFFTDYYVDEIENLNNIIKRFRNEFINLKKGSSKSDLDTIVLTYLSPDDLFYMCRFTTYKIMSEGVPLHVNIEEQGFPVRSDISVIYEVNRSKGEIPINNKYDYLANCPPELEFYTKRSGSLGNSICSFFENDLPIMEK
jgi:hypothetical protein